MNSKTTFTGSVLLSALFGTTSAFAAELNVPGDFATIQDAIDAAAAGDEILIGNGNWAENLEIIGTPVTLRAADTVSPLVIINPLTADPGITVLNMSGTVVLEDLAIVGGDQGGLAADDANVTARRCNFNGNTSTAFPGAGAYLNDGEYRFEDCRFFANDSTQIASAIAITEGQLFLSDCTLSGNSTTNGTTLIAGDAGVTMRGCAVVTNNGTTFPAMVGVGNTGYTVENTYIFNNSDDDSASTGAPVGVIDGATMKMYNCTFKENDAAYSAGGNGNYVFTNCILPAGASGVTVPGVTTTMEYCLVEGGHAGAGNINGVATYESSPFQSVQLAAGSLGIDAANSNAIDLASIPTDFYGHSRVIDDLEVGDTGVGSTSSLDIGCAERVPPIRYVNKFANGLNNGQSWNDAYTDLMDAIEETSSNLGPVSEIWVRAAEYAPDRGTGDRDATFAMRGGLAIRGGFTGNETSVDQADPANNPTTLTGKIAGAGSPDNTRHVVTAIDVAGTGILDGFRIVDGYASGPGGNDTLGAGMYIEGGHPHIQRCVFRGNNGVGKGYVFRAIDSNFWMESCRIEFNGLVAHGLDAVRAEGDMAIIRNSAITANRVEGNGALYLGGISEAVLTNVTLAGNVATSGARAGLVGADINLFMQSTLIGANASAGAQPGGLNTQFALDSQSTSDGIACSIEGYFDGLLDFANSCDDRAFGFVDARGPDQIPATGDEDFALRSGSCAIDAGWNQYSITEYGDAALMARVRDDNGTPDTGNPHDDPATIDRGAFEYQGQTCRGDINQDLVIGFADLTIVLNQWGVCSGGCAADLDCNSVVDFSDLVLILNNWGECDQF